MNRKTSLPALGLLFVLLFISSFAFWREYHKKAIWFSNTDAASRAFRQPETFVSEELDSFGFAYPKLDCQVAYKPILTFLGKEGKETEFALTKLAFEDTAIRYGRNLNEAIGLDGYSVVASPNEFYECVSQVGTNHSYAKLCNGCGLQRHQKDPKVGNGYRIGMAQVIPVKNGPYKNYGVHNIVNAVVVPNYSNQNRFIQNSQALTEINTYTKNISAQLKKISDTLEGTALLIQSPYLSLEKLSDEIFQPIKAERIKILKKALHDIFSKLQPPNNWGKDRSLENLVLPMITTGAGGVSYEQFFETLFSVIGVRMDSTAYMPKRLILSVYPEQKDLIQIKEALAAALLKFYASREHKQVINQQRLSFLARVIGITTAMILFIGLFIYQIIPFPEAHRPTVQNNLFFFSLAMIMSSIGLTTLVKSYVDNFISWDNVGKYFYIGLVGFISLFVQYLAFQLKPFFNLIGGKLS